MRTHSHNQKRTVSKSNPAPVSSQLQSRPFAVRAKSTPERETQDCQTRLEQAKQFGYDLTDIPVFAFTTPSPPVSPTIQPKLAISQPGDKYEQKANQIANEVMSIAAPIDSPSVQRQMALEPEEVQTKPSVWHRAFPESSIPAPTTVSLSQTDSIQRDVNDLITTPVVLDGDSILTYEELATWYGWRKLSLIEQRDELNREGLAVPDSVTQAITSAQELIDLNIGGGAEPITEGIVSDTRAWLRTYTSAMNTAEAEKGAEAARRLRNAEERAREAQTNIEETVIPQLRERQRSNFRSEDDSGLLQVADTIGTALDTLMNLKDVMLEIRREAAVLENMRNLARGYRGLIPSANSRAPIVIGILDRINQLYAGFQLLRAGIDIVAGRHRTESAAARSGVSAMATAYSAGGTLLGASAGVSMYANFYIGPMTSACLDALGRLEDIVSRTQNRTWIELGEYDWVNWSIEPGGRPMFNFMRRVMQAGSSSDIPTPIPAPVESYLMDHRDSFNAGIGSHRGAMPTTGWIFKDLDPSQAASWVFINRDNLWGMLYGAATPPR